ncbi:MAG: hypothetical protein JO092_06690 [Candidatus Eremiobacteraeota bacterium]|nr:hypothetical protein [Candidatus Eremiobacteraeota bacterium]
MKLERTLWLGALLAMTAVCAAAATTPDGNTILAKAAAEHGLASYSVPVHFDLRMHKPIGFKSGADGIAYFKAPAKAAIAITHVPGPLGGFFKGSYTLDMVP